MVDEAQGTTTEETKSQEEVIDKQQENSGVVGRPFVKGDPRINREGRPKGKTIKELVRQHLDDNPEDMQEFVRHFIRENRSLAWQMLEGRPQQDVTSDGKQLPTPILNVLRNDSDNKDSEPKEEN